MGKRVDGINRCDDECSAEDGQIARCRPTAAYLPWQKERPALLPYQEHDPERMHGVILKPGLRVSVVSQPPRLASVPDATSFIGSRFVIRSTMLRTTTQGSANTALQLAYLDMYKTPL